MESRDKFDHADGCVRHKFLYSEVFKISNDAFQNKPTLFTPVSMAEETKQAKGYQICSVYTLMLEKDFQSKYQAL